MFFRKLVLKTMAWSGLYTLLRARRKGAIVLAYHGVEREIIDRRIQTVHISLRRFHRQVEYIRNHFEVISLYDLSQRLHSGEGLDGHQVVLTFDDGYRNNLEIVAPVLESLSMPFAVFVCTEHIRTGLRMPTYRLRAGIYFSERRSCRIRGFEEEFDLSTLQARDAAMAMILPRYKSSPETLAQLMVEDVAELIPEGRWREIDDRFSSDAPMNWEEVEILQGMGATIGSHARSHFILHPGQEVSRIREEIQLSKSEVEKRLGSCRHFAYPNGTSQDISPDAVKEVGNSRYELAFTAEFGEVRTGSDRRLLPRVDADDGFEYLKFYLNTAYRPGRGG